MVTIQSQLDRSIQILNEFGLRQPGQTLNQYFDSIDKNGVMVAFKKIKAYNFLKDKINEHLRSWSQNKVPSSETQVNFETHHTAEERSDLIKKVKNCNLAGKIMLVATLALIIFSIAFTTTHFIIGLPFVVTLVPWSVVTALSVSLLIMINVIEKKSCERRLIASKNFNFFVNETLIDSLNFVPTQNDLLDYDLHKIYKDWKNSAHEIFNRQN